MGQELTNGSSQICLTDIGEQPSVSTTPDTVEGDALVCRDYQPHLLPGCGWFIWRDRRVDISEWKSSGGNSNDAATSYLQEQGHRFSEAECTI